MFNSLELLRISVGNPEVDLGILRGMSLFFSEVRQRTEPFFVGKDTLFYPESMEKNRCFGYSLIPKDYFGINFGSPEDMMNFILYLVSARNYATRSKLTQPGLSVLFESIGFDKEGSSVVLRTNITSLTGKPLVNIPECFPLFRLFTLDLRNRIEGRKLEEIAPSVFPLGYQLVSVDGYNVAVILPIEKYFDIDAEEIDVAAILKTKSRAELDCVLRLRESEKPADYNGYVLGETGIVGVPTDHLMVIFPGADDNHHIHLPSSIIDSNFQGGIRVEINRLGSQPEFVEFHLIKKAP